jgi:hypothetical protein
MTNELDIADNIFLKKYRMDKELFNWLCDQLHDDLQKDTRGRGAPLSSQFQVAVALYRLGHGCSYTVVGDVFGIGVSTVSIIIHNLVKLVVEKLYNKTIW